MRTIKYLSIAAFLLLVGLFYLDNSAYISKSFQRFVDGFFTFLLILVYAAGVVGAIILGLAIFERVQRRLDENRRQRDGSYALQTRKGKDGKVHVLNPAHMMGATATFDENAGWVEPEPVGGYTPQDRVLVRIEAQRTADLQAISPGDEVMKLVPMLGKAAAAGTEKVLRALNGIGGNTAQEAQRALTGPVGEDMDMEEAFVPMTGVQAVMQATPNNFIYGYGANGALCKVDMHSSVNVGIVGAPGCGKTASSGYQSGLNVMNFGGRLIVLDGKGGIDWKLFARVAEHHMMTGDTLADQMHYVHQEYERRMAMVAKFKVQHMSELVHPEFPPIYVVVEEYGANAADMNKKDAEFCDGIINEMTKKGRVTDIHFIVIDQNPKETWSQMLLMATKAKLVYQMGPNQGNTVGEWHAQNLPDKGAFLHRKVQYNAWFMAPELEAMLKQVPTNPWPALMPDVTDWRQPLFPGNAGGPPIVVRKPTQIGQNSGQMSGQVSGQQLIVQRPGVVQAQAGGESWMPVDPDSGRVMDKSFRREREPNIRRDLGDDGYIRKHSARSGVPGEGIFTPETPTPTPVERPNDRMTERMVSPMVSSIPNTDSVDPDGWVITSPQHRQALGLGTLAVSNILPAAGVTEYAPAADKTYTDDIERVDPRSVRNVSETRTIHPDETRTLPRRPQAAPEPPTLTEKQEKVFAYFEANARYDSTKQKWIFPTVAVMAEETGCAGSYVQDLKAEWLADKQIGVPRRGRHQNPRFMTSLEADSPSNE